MAKLFVTASIGLQPREEKEFTDWYDVADWIKQVNLAGGYVIIFSWRYSHG